MRASTEKDVLMQGKGQSETEFARVRDDMPLGIWLIQMRKTFKISFFSIMVSPGDTPMDSNL